MNEVNTHIVAPFLAGLETKNIRIKLSGEELDVSAPKGVLTPAIIDEIRARKPQIIDWLRARTAVQPIPSRAWQPGDRVPALFAQVPVWLTSQLQPDAPVLNVWSAHHLRGNLKIDALRQSLDLLVARHQSLRVTFALEGDVLTQTVLAPYPVLLPIIDCVDEANAHEILHQHARQPFDLSNGQLLRALLIRLAPDHHVLLLVIHHISTDEWSQEVFWRELVKSYTAFIRGDAPDLPVNLITDADFAVWQRAYMTGAVLQQHLAYWQEQLAGIPKTLELPTDRPRPRVPTAHGAEVHATLDAGLVNRLTAFASAHNVTLFAVLMASFTLLIARYTRQHHFVIGTPVATRTRPETENVVGLLSNILALPMHVTGSFSELLAQVRTTTLNAMEFSDLPYDQFLQFMPQLRQSDSFPALQTAFVLHTSRNETICFPDLEFDRFPLERLTSRFDLLLLVHSVRDGMEAIFEYSTDLFDAATVEHMAQHWLALLHAALDMPEQSVFVLPMMDTHERQRILIEWNNTKRPYPRDSTLAQEFERWVAKSPDSIAVIEGDRVLTYAELDAAANGVAHTLQRVGIQPEAAIGVFLPRSIDTIIAMLGVIKAGGAYVPLDTYYPPARLSLLIQDSQVEIILTTAQHLPTLDAPNKRVIDLAECSPLPSAPHSMATADSLLQIIYTSGSTGTPKGIEVTHRNVLRLVCNPNYVSLSPSETILHISSVSFDAAAFEVWGGLLNGGKLVIYPERYINYGDIATLIRRHSITVVFLTTSLFHQLLDYDTKILTHVGQVLAGGEVLSPIHALRAKQHGIALINAYGPTENTTFSAYYKITGDEKGDIPIGRPIANSQVYILDETLNPQPIGIVGELYVGGDGVARGYRHHPQLSAERFIDHAVYGRLYRTGDDARWLPDGNIAYLGRRDLQLKVRGFRIEPEEIEQTILQIDGVREAVVVAREAIQGERQLIAYVVGTAHPESIWARLRAQLPSHMIPSLLMPLDVLPLTANGKLDRTALPIPVKHKTDFAPPRTPIEAQLAAIWSDILKQQDISIHDDFFSIGGDSLKAAQISAVIERNLGFPLRVIALFHTPTIERLADYMQAGLRESGDSHLVLLQAGEQHVPPLFLIHGVGGEVLNYVPLVKHLPPHQTVYGLQAKRLTDMSIIPTMEALAAQYIDAIRTVQPHGPYRLSGHSFGGWLAYEMAQQLKSAGEEIALLALLDTSPKFFSDSVLENLQQYVRFQSNRIRSLILALSTRNPQEWTKYVRVRWQSFRQRKGVYQYVKMRQGEQLPHYGRDIMTFAPEVFQHQVDVYRVVGRAYRIQPYTGNIVVFYVGQPDTSIFQFHWRQMSKSNPTFRSIPGNHLTLLEEPHVQTLAIYLSEFLDGVMSTIDGDP